jgi:hypothetical protein
LISGGRAGRERRVHQPDDGAVLLDGLNGHIDKLIYQPNRRCLSTHFDQVNPERVQQDLISLFVWPAAGKPLSAKD